MGQGGSNLKHVKEARLVQVCEVRAHKAPAKNSSLISTTAALLKMVAHKSPPLQGAAAALTSRINYFEADILWVYFSHSHDF